MQNTKIEWTDATWNPVRGCSRVSEGCRNCYAENIARRFSGPGKPYEGLVSDHGTFNGNIMLAQKMLDTPFRWQRPRRVFVNSTSDLFHDGVPDWYIDRVFAVMALCPQHQFQILTKRPARMLQWFRRDPDLGRIMSECHMQSRKRPYTRRAIPDRRNGYPPAGWEICSAAHQWPLPNVWLGVSVENQKAADERIPLLLQTPAAIRFISAEPLLGPVDLTDLHGSDSESFCIDGLTGDEVECYYGDRFPRFNRVDWVIAGGESGKNARPMHPEWARSLRDQCAAADVPFFFKQWGRWAPVDLAGEEGAHDWFIVAHNGDHDIPDGRAPDARQGEVAMRPTTKAKAGRTLDGRTWDQYPEAAA